MCGFPFLLVTFIVFWMEIRMEKKTKEIFSQPIAEILFFLHNQFVINIIWKTVCLWLWNQFWFCFRCFFDVVLFCFVQSDICFTFIFYQADALVLFKINNNEMSYNSYNFIGFIHNCKINNEKQKLIRQLET